jgi:predicted aspartyl protease
MLQPVLSRAALIFLSSGLTVLITACVPDKQAIIIDRQKSSLPLDHLSAIQPSVKPGQPKPTQKVSPPNVLELALDKADSGLSISQSAQSADEWKLVVNQFQEAIALMKQVRRDSPNFGFAQQKIGEYRRQVAYAQRQPRQFSDAVTPLRRPAKVSKIKLSPGFPPRQQLTKPVFQTSKLFIPSHEVFITPIKRRIGGTPIIEVTFNGKQRFEMIVDTGASGTVITQQIATALGVVTVGKAKANTVNSRSVEFPVGYLDSMEVGGVTMNKIPVAIAGKELEIGLLGHDFFGNYDVTIKRNTIEFRPQSRTETNLGETPPTPPTLSRRYRFLEFPGRYSHLEHGLTGESPQRPVKQKQH